MIKFDVEVIDSAGDVWLMKEQDGAVQSGPVFQCWVNRSTGGDGKEASVLMPEKRVQDVSYFFNPRRAQVTPREV